MQDERDHRRGSPPGVVRGEERTTATGARGRRATTPTEIGQRGWRDVLIRVGRELAEDDVALIGAAVAFYLFLSIFPLLAACVSVYGLVADPADVHRQLAELSALPAEVRELLSGSLERHVSTSSGALGWTLVGSVLLAVWSASKGMRALMKAMNVAYGEEERRGLPKLVLISLAFTLGTVLLMTLAVTMIVGVPALFRSIGLDATGGWVGVALAWVVLLAGFLTALSTLYRWGPCRSDAQWRWLTPGAVLATLMWALASVAFSFYASTFASYGETYGSLAAVVVSMLWLWISSLAVLVGAEFNSEMEHQTGRDTTTGPWEPRGERGAYVADTLGRRP